MIRYHLEREGVHWKLNVQGQGAGKILEVGWQEGWRVLKTGEFSWTPYVYRPFLEFFRNYYHNFRWLLLWTLPNGHSTLSQPRLDGDITSIHWRLNFDGFPRHLRIIFQCNLEIHVVSTYFFWYNIDGRKVHVVSTYFCWCNFDVEKSTLFAPSFYDVI